MMKQDSQGFGYFAFVSYISIIVKGLTDDLDGVGDQVKAYPDALVFF